MRAGLHPFPGRDWPVLTGPPDVLASERRWWKLDVVESWLDGHPEVGAFAWCDDHLLGGRPAAVRRRLTPRGLQPLLLTPRTEVGLTPAHLDRLEAWARS